MLGLLSEKSVFPNGFLESIALMGRGGIRDGNGQQLAYVYYEEEPGRQVAAKMLTKDAARRITANIAKLPELLSRERLADRLGLQLPRPRINWLSDLAFARRRADLRCLIELEL